MHDEFSVLAEAAPGTEVTIPDPENPGLSVSGHIANVDVPARTVTINVVRRGTGPTSISVKFPDTQPEPGTALPEGEK